MLCLISPLTLKGENFIGGEHDYCNDVHCLYAGTYTLDFRYTEEAKVSINLPAGINGSMSDPYNGIDGFFCGAFHIVEWSSTGSTVTLTFLKGVGEVPNGTRVDVVIPTKRAYPYYPYGYYFVHADLLVLN